VKTLEILPAPAAVAEIADADASMDDDETGGRSDNCATLRGSPRAESVPALHR
jgi:hypothetical protein